MKKTVKRILSVVVMLLLIAYMALAFTAFSPRPAGDVCDGIVLTNHKGGSQFDNEGDVLDLLRRFKLNPVGKPMDEISCAAIEDSLRNLSLVLSCECFKTVGTKVGLDITCRTPILHVIDNRGKNFYIDEEGVLLDRVPRPLYLPVATGYIDSKFAENDLFRLATFLRKDAFWNAQIVQINVTADHEVELVPRVGGQIIRLGKVENLKYKFNKLMVFYKEGLSQIGWERYSILDIRYGNQVIGIK
ncbi:MAG: cell division protein FtsQ [Bacteroidaceae bacterium]|nr:cell division protein FtsQ [Bacteroidaceae bacterium]